MTPCLNDEGELENNMIDNHKHASDKHVMSNRCETRNVSGSLGSIPNRFSQDIPLGQ